MSGKKAEEKRLATLWAQVDKAETKAANDFLTWCGIQLGLAHWDLYIGEPPCAASAIASCDASRLRYTACIQLSRDWVTRDRWVQANAMLHECLHVSHFWLTEVVRDELFDALPKGKGLRAGAYKVITGRSRTESERMVDQLATALTDSLNAVKAWKRIRKAHGLKP